MSLPFKLFNPDELRDRAPAFTTERRAFVADYEYDDKITLAVNVALAANRPLLLRGDAGSGKSTLAEDVARLLHRRYYEQVISSTVEAADLLWRIDHVSRIADAQAGKRTAGRQPSNYLQPGILFWAYAPLQARSIAARDPDLRTWQLASPHTTPAVVLLDEIDKAEPDFPNDLLVPLGSLLFHVPALNCRVQAPPEMRPLVIVTTNEERDLSPAFLRRCVVLRLTTPDNDEHGRARLTKIARRHFDDTSLDHNTLEAVMRRYFELREAAAKARIRPPSTAEFLDTLRAVVELRGTGADDFVLEQGWVFREVTQASLWKPRELPLRPA